MHPMAKFQTHIPLLLISIICLLNLKSQLIHGHESERQPQTKWLNHGGDRYNRRYAARETKISPSTASKLHLKWEFNAGKDVTATPAISDGVVYFPSWNGYIYAVKAADGSLVWRQNLQRLTGLNSTLQIMNVTAMLLSRTTPTIAGDKLIVPIYGPAYVVALTRDTGRLVWTRQLDTHPLALITMSGTYYERGLYIGVSSLEETASIENCCTFRGSFAKLDIRTGSILWQTYMIPDKNATTGGYAGAAVWGSSPSIDAHRNHVYIATGNLYSVPREIEQCQERQQNQTVPTHQEECVDDDVHFDSFVALDLESGEIKWYRQLGGYDVWFFACNNSTAPNCPPGPNPDADFGEAPMMVSVDVNGSKVDMVVAVQKSGYAWALDRTNGDLLWSTKAGPGGAAVPTHLIVHYSEGRARWRRGGGGSWGAATDTRRIYTNIANSNMDNFTLLPSNKVTNGGGWVAMDAKTGTILWSTAVPNGAMTNPVTVANGVLFAGSTYSTGPVYAIDTKNGEILWSYETGASVYGGFSVSQGCVYVGSGYGVSVGALLNFTSGTSLFSFCLD